MTTRTATQPGTQHSQGSEKRRNEKYERWPSLRFYDQLGVPYVLGAFRWVGPLWTGHCMMLDTTDHYRDAGFFHELAHWLAATPRQRSLPDFGLDRQINATAEIYATSTTPFVFDQDDNFQQRGWGERCVSPRTAQGQEGLACEALAVYEPLVGLVSWDSVPQLDDLNPAMFDFTGSDGLIITAKVIERLHRRIVTPLDPSVSAKSVATYLRRLADQLKD